jgi:hypothetical protein
LLRHDRRIGRRCQAELHRGARRPAWTAMLSRQASPRTERMSGGAATSAVPSDNPAATPNAMPIAMRCRCTRGDSRRENDDGNPREDEQCGVREACHGALSVGPLIESSAAIHYCTTTEGDPMAEIDNPYRTPAAPVADVLDDAAPDGNYVDGGRDVESGRGWGWIRDGWTLFRRQAGMWIVLTILFFLIVMSMQFVPVLGMIASVLLVPVFVAGLMTGAQTVSRGGELELAHLFAGFRRNTGQLMLVGVIGFVLTFIAMIPMTLVMGAGLFVAGATSSSIPAFGAATLLALLISLALLVPINMAMWFSSALVILQDHSAARAIGQSFRGCLKNIVPFLLYGIILFFFAMIAAIPFGLGWLVLGPVVLCSVYIAYRDIYFTA